MGGRSSGQSATAWSTLQLQTSAYGIPIPVLGGVTRVAGNLIYYNDFIASASSSSGGKGGGGGQAQPSNYTYTASVLMALCHGQINHIPRVWKGQTCFSDTTGTTQTGTPQNMGNASENYAVPSGGGTYTVAHAAVFGALTEITATITNRNGSYQVTGALDIDYTQSNGIFTFPAGSSLDGRTVNIAYTYTTSVATNPALYQMGLSMMAGNKGQTAPSWISSLHPANALGYSNMACVTGQNYLLNSNAQVDNHNFEVVGPGAYSISPTVPDIDIASFAVSLLENLRYGAMVPSQYINSTAAWTKSNLANNLLFSPCLDAQIKASDFITQAAMLTNTGLVWSAGSLKFIPYCDAIVTGNGVTYTPNLTPIYSLTDDVFITTDGDPPIQITRMPAKQCYNHFRVSFKNRLNSYAQEIAEAKDAADIQNNLLRSADIVDASWCCDPNIARNIAQFLLQRSMYQRNTYEFTLPWNYTYLEPMDIVDITDVNQGLNSYAVRVLSIDEEDGDLKFVCEDFNQGVANTAAYNTQIGAGFGHNYNVAPGVANAPVIFEAPVTFTSNGLEVCIAASSSNAYWGGCFVWVSMDGTNYKQAGKITGNSRYGKVTSDSGTSMGVSGLLAAMTAGTAADSAAYADLCYIGGSTPEYIGYAGATLTGAGAYTLSGLTRAGYNTSQATQPNGAPFVRVDDNVIQSGAIDLNMIGQTVYIKLCGFNVYGGGIQSLVNVTAYPYVIQGTMLKLPPAPPSGLGYTFTAAGIFFLCTKSSNPDIVRYEYRQGATWITAALLTHDGSTSYTWPPQVAGTYTVWVAAVDIFGNYSAATSVSVTIALPTMATISSGFSGTNLNLNWPAATGTFPIVKYEVRRGASGVLWGAATSMGFFAANSYTENVAWNGTLDYLVAAIDSAGNVSTPVRTTATLTIAAINTFTSSINGPNLQLNWTATAGSLNIFDYEVRKGAPGVAWASATSMGFYNTNTYIENTPATGSHDYLVAAYDMAGNVSAPVRVSVVMIAPSAPPSGYPNVIDNDVLLYWTAPSVAANQLPIASYKNYVGATFSTSTLIGNNGNSTFAFVFESVAGTYNFWITAVDTAGVEGPPLQITATVNQPPDFILQNNYNSALGGTFTNAYTEQGRIFLPFDTTKTWATHYTANGWTTPAAQVSAGYPLYAEPSLTSATYTEIINYGVSIPTTMVTATIGLNVIAGSVSWTCQIYWKLNVGDPWTALAAGPVALIPASFQYVQIVYSFASTAGANLAQIVSLNVKLATKIRNDNGNGTSIGASPGTAITFAYPFIQANIPVVTVGQLDTHGLAYKPAVIYTGTPNPTGFNVRMFDSAGLEAAGIPFSWTARGF